MDFALFMSTRSFVFLLCYTLVSSTSLPPSFYLPNHILAVLAGQLYVLMMYSKHKECLSCLNPKCSKHFATPCGLTHPACAPLVDKILQDKLQQQDPIVKVELAASVVPFLEQMNSLFHNMANNEADDTEDSTNARFPSQGHNDPGSDNEMASTPYDEASQNSHSSISMLPDAEDYGLTFQPPDHYLQPLVQPSHNLCTQSIPK